MAKHLIDPKICSNDIRMAASHTTFSGSPLVVPEFPGPDDHFFYVYCPEPRKLNDRQMDLMSQVRSYERLLIDPTLTHKIDDIQWAIKSLRVQISFPNMSVTNRVDWIKSANLV